MTEVTTRPAAPVPDEPRLGDRAWIGEPHQVLAAALTSDRTRPERVAEVLRLRPEDVPPIAAGRVGLAATAWKRVLREIGQ